MLKEKAKKVLLPVTTGAMMVMPTMSSYASGLDLSSITTSAVDQIQSDMTIVITAFVTGAVALVSITVGVSYLLKKAKAMKTVA